jgi:hypothetical protein
MSLVSASGVISGIKEYTYRGIQELPMVLSLTSFVFAITTGSIAHSTLLVGLGVIMPAYTFLMQSMMGYILGYFFSAGRADWTCSSSDVCNIIPSYKKLAQLSFYTDNTANGSVVPSYWITGMGFFFGFIFSNAADTLQTPMFPGSDPIGHEKRNTQSLFLIAASAIFFVILMFIRFYFMKGCEGRGPSGIAISVFFGLTAMGIGWGFYVLSKVCGARSSDLFGVLSQILPASATAPSPVVCTAE